MKNIKILLSLFALLVVITSCEKEGEKPILDESAIVAPLITAPIANAPIVLTTLVDNDSTSVIFDEADFNLNIATTSLLEMSTTAGFDSLTYKNAVTVMTNVGTKAKLAIKNSALNTFLKAAPFKFPVGVSSIAYIRIHSFPTVGSGVPTTVETFSPVVMINVNPHK